MRVLDKHPEITDPRKRERFSCRAVASMFLARPWVETLRETRHKSYEDNQGFDMFVRVSEEFVELMMLTGTRGFLPVQIKSSYKTMRRFLHDYANSGRFFQVQKNYHQFVFCGMDESEYVLAYLVAQLVVHVSFYGLDEEYVLSRLVLLGDKEAVIVYRRYRTKTLFDEWLGTMVG